MPIDPFLPTILTLGQTATAFAAFVCVCIPVQFCCGTEACNSANCMKTRLQFAHLNFTLQSGECVNGIMATQYWNKHMWPFAVFFVTAAFATLAFLADLVFVTSDDSHNTADCLWALFEAILWAIASGALAWKYIDLKSAWRDKVRK